MRTQYVAGGRPLQNSQGKRITAANDNFGRRVSVDIQASDQITDAEIEVLGALFFASCETAANDN